MKVSYLGPMSPARAWTRTTWSRNEHTNYEATVYSTILKGIKNSDNLSLLDWGSWCFSKKEVQYVVHTENMNTRALALLIYNAETPEEGSILLSYRETRIEVFKTVQATLILHTAKISYEDSILYSENARNLSSANHSWQYRKVWRHDCEIRAWKNSGFSGIGTNDLCNTGLSLNFFLA